MNSNPLCTFVVKVHDESLGAIDPQIWILQFWTEDRIDQYTVRDSCGGGRDESLFSFCLMVYLAISLFRGFCNCGSVNLGVCLFLGPGVQTIQVMSYWLVKWDTHPNPLVLFTFLFGFLLYWLMRCFFSSPAKNTEHSRPSLQYLC